MGFQVGCLSAPRFQSDPNLGGTEKLSISAMRPDLGMVPPHTLCATDIDEQYEGFLAPCGAFMVKGWTRSFCAVSIMLCSWKNEEFREAGCAICLPTEV